jgi:hypothetical protein
MVDLGDPRLRELPSRGTVDVVPNGGTGHHGAMRKLMGLIGTFIVAVIIAIIWAVVGGFLQDFLAPRLNGLQNFVDGLAVSGGMVWLYLIVAWSLMIIIPMVVMARRRARWRGEAGGTTPLPGTERD